MEGESIQHKMYKSTLHRMTQTTPTILWNDSCSIAELTSSIGDGAVGGNLQSGDSPQCIKAGMGYLEE